MVVKKILWLSRHEPTHSQHLALQILYNGFEVQVEQDSNTFSGVKDIVDRFKRGKYDDLVIVAPMSMVSKLTELGLRPLWAKMQRVKRQYAECCNNGRHYAFVEFKRIKALEFTFEDELLPL